MDKIKVLIIDDSAVMRKVLSAILAEDPEIEVVGTAPDPLIARDKIKMLHPDVLTLDVEMPRMDGLTFLRNLMRLRPMPVVMISTMTERGAATTMEALALGAVDFVAKPKIDAGRNLEQYAEEIVAKVKGAARARVRPLRGDPTGNTDWDLMGREAEAPLAPPPSLGVDAVIPRRAVGRTAGVVPLVGALGRLIAIGASTGGTEAIKDVLLHMPAQSPPVVVTQHIPPKFSTMFARRMDGLVPMTVYEAEDHQPITTGCVYIAPGDRHLLVDKTRTGYVCRLSDGPLVNRHRPSVDVLFRSVADVAGPHAVGAILTGMGADGAVGLKEIRDRGGQTIAQDEESSVVWGMPGEAVRAGAAEKVLPLDAIAAEILRLVGGGR
jgi:two-component system chemotaxis response regulator CheB